MNIMHILFGFSVFLCISLRAEEAANIVKTNMATSKKISWYLVSGPAGMTESKNPKLSELEVQKTPLFTSDDIVYYNRSHSFVLTDEAYRKIRDLFVPVRGTPFVVRVGDRRAYFGAFWTDVSSVPWSGITIMKPWQKENTELKILPSDSKLDLRDDSELLDILKESKKLVAEK